MAISSRNKVSMQFSMSGMTDIVFLLLIFFMLTSTLIAPNAIKLLLPKSDNQTSSAPPKVVVSINADLRYYIGEKRVSASNLEAALTKELQYRVDPVIALRADKSVPIEHVVRVMNIARNNKYRLILATAPED